MHPEGGRDFLRQESGSIACFDFESRGIIRRSVKPQGQKIGSIKRRRWRIYRLPKNLISLGAHGFNKVSRGTLKVWRQCRKPRLCSSLGHRSQKWFLGLLAWEKSPKFSVLEAESSRRLHYSTSFLEKVIILKEKVIF
jgi:hypothetical protein